MPVPTLPELITPVTADTVMSQELAYAQVIGLPATAWQPISIGREILYINASVVASFSEVMQSGVVAGESDLDLLTRRRIQGKPRRT